MKVKMVVQTCTFFLCKIGVDGMNRPRTILGV